jgi:hypothetical protein
VFQYPGDAMPFMRSFFVGIAACVAAVFLAMVAAVQAADTTTFMPDAGYVDPIYDSPLFNFEGFYAGALVGAGWYQAPTGIVGSVGFVAGANFGLTDSLLLGAEFQADAFFNGGGFNSYDALFKGHLGTYLTDSSVVYGALGAGLSQGTTSYVLGGGVEAAMMGNLSARGEILGIGPWGAMPNGAKINAGVIWHMN